MNHRLIVILINHGHIKWHLVKTHSHFLLKAVFTDAMMYSQKRTVVTPCQFVFWKDKSNPSCLTTSQLTSTNSVISHCQKARGSVGFLLTVSLLVYQPKLCLVVLTIPLLYIQKQVMKTSEENDQALTK